ncbi:hypothetical protein [Pseudorhodoplanes sinuspersici]|uniref:hypothetical protein n=1 Tax=Pseudorhodoplanes sinuspersici TaxID=1235591 RepID=UPI000FF7226E|nr:hypothetical protein [Pseudorhodoplanes sinuspersici]RKE70473.1 hypothetical protein DFP91_2704 [Pseudorhodoplanes sinuspersici]
MAHIEELRPQYRRPADAGAHTTADQRSLEWTDFVVPVAVMCTVAWIFFLFWLAVRLIEVALA